MKIITNSSITGITATSENANYPAANLLDEHPKKKWMAADSTVSSARLDIMVSGRTGGMGMVGIVADSAVVTVSDPTGITWVDVSWQNVTWDAGNDDLEASVTMDRVDDYASLWVEFEEFDGTVDISVTLFIDAGTPETLSAGVVVAGLMENVPGVEYPLQEGLEDYSPLRKLSNGAEWYDKRDIVRTFSGRIFGERAINFYVFMRDVARKYGKRPMMYHMADIAGEWTLYGRLNSMPVGSHDSLDLSGIDFELIEVL